MKLVIQMENLETKVAEPSLQASTDYLVALMVLKEVEAQNELDPLLHGLKSRLDKSKVGANPYHMLNTAFSQEAIVESKAAYAEIWEHIYKEIAEASIKSSLPHAGYTQDEIDSLPEEVIQHFNTVSLFEEKFPDEGSKNFPLLERLKAGKDMLFDALGSDKGKAALSAASWGISLATGGIVTRLAIKGGAALASRLIENESVQNFAGKMQQRVTNFLQRTGVPTGTIAGHFRDFKDNAKSVMASPTFQRYGKPSLALAGIALGAIMVGNLNHDKLVELASTSWSKGADLAQSGADLATEGFHAAKDLASTAVDHTVDAVSDAGTFVANTAIDAYQDPVATLQQIADTGLDVARGANDLLVDAASGTIDAVTQAPSFIADVAKSGYESATVALGGAAEAAGHAVDSTRQFVADGFHGAGNLVAGTDAAHVDPSVDAGIASKDLLTDADVTASVPLGGAAPTASDLSHSVAGPVATNYEIHKGDSLWKISKEAFEANGIEPTNHQIHEATQKLYEANKDLIGANPDKIMAGADLRVDPALFTAKVDAVVENDHLKAMGDMIGTKAGFPIETSVSQVTPPDLNAAPAATDFKSDRAKLGDLLGVSPKDGAVSFGEAVKRVSSRDVGSDSTLGM
ncbi:LysM peptidoglycan-binding domain-containing protein [Pseudomonas sp. CFBP 13719]|uniref:LysM peptidoglycan-binding domain-containing protein n=1 Tax=Pseudomonas sp. CFBP 13719 TaxID=2775303 RepID=UPI0018FEE53C|nr:hypothetical protein [Pseudomonas sp. CFBP 13719]